MTQSDPLGFPAFPRLHFPDNHRGALLNRDPHVPPVDCGGTLQQRHQVGRLMVMRCLDCQAVLLVHVVSHQVFWSEGFPGRESVSAAMSVLDAIAECGETDPVTSDAIGRAYRLLATALYGRPR